MARENSQSPLVAVVIPAYNRECCIADAIESVLAQQTDFRFEVIVVDDGSTDRTADVARSYRAPVRVISKQNGGPASARNAGVLAATSPLIAFLDSDDLMLPGRLARQAEFLLAHPDVVLTFGDILLEAWPVPGPTVGRASPGTPNIGRSYLKSRNLPFVENQWLIADEPYRRIMTQGNFVNNPTTMLRKDDYIKAGMMDESLWVAEDAELWTRMCSTGKFAYFCAPFTRVRRNPHDNLMSSHHAQTDIARVRHKLLLRDRTLTPREKRQSLALLRKHLRKLLLYDLLQQGRRQMLNDLREMGFWFGRSYFLRWWALTLIPCPLVRLLRDLRSRINPQQ